MGRFIVPFRGEHEDGGSSGPRVQYAVICDGLAANRGPESANYGRETSVSKLWSAFRPWVRLVHGELNERFPFSENRRPRMRFFQS